MVFLKEKVSLASSYLSKKGVRGATTGLFLDNGMGGFSNELSQLVVAQLRKIPHFPYHLSTRQRNALLYGQIEGRPVVVLEGRGCLYEGYFHRELAVPLRTLSALGMRTLLLVAHITAIQKDWSPGELFVVEDHIDLTGGSPLRGIIPEGEQVFPLEMEHCYEETLREKIRRLAAEKNQPLHSGVLALLPGPALPTAAEERMLAGAGADAYTLSLGAEIVAARFLGLKAAALGLLSEGGAAEKQESETWGVRQVNFLRDLISII